MRSSPGGLPAIWKIDGGAAQTRLLIERAAAANIMCDIGDMDLQMPTAVFAAFDVNCVVEVSRRLAINGNDRQAAKIFSLSQFLFGGKLCTMIGFCQYGTRKFMRQMMLANNNLGVDAQFPGAAENFQHAAARRGTGARKAQDLNVHDRAIEFVEAGNALAAVAWILCFAQL